MLSKLKEYFHSAIKKPVYLCSTILDPWLKTSQLTSDVLSLMGLNKDNILATFKSESEKYILPENYSSSEPQETSSRSTISSSLFKKKKRRITSLDDEIDLYLSSECKEEAYWPLVFWKANSEQFPSLSNMARTYLAVPASSAPCIRAFSFGQPIKTYTWNRMSLTTLESLICLKNRVGHDIIDFDHYLKVTTT